MSDRIVNYIREVARKVLGVSTVNIGGGEERSKGKWKLRRLPIWSWWRAKTRR